MALESKLASELIRKFPGRAVDALERLGAEEGARVLGQGSARQAAALLERVSPLLAAEILGRLPDERVAGILAALPIGCASRLARRLREDRMEPVFAALPARVARGIRSLIGFPEHSAGALMDPGVLALPEDLTAREALARVREAPEQTRYNIYVVDPHQKLVGVVTLRELFLARPGAVLTELMVRNPIALDAVADRSVVVSHPGWKEVHALPVVDAEGCYLGAIRYRTLRQLEELLLGGSSRDARVHEALGQLFSAGASGLVDALTSPVSTRTGGA